MAKVKVNLERSICVGSHGGFQLKAGERHYHDDVAKAIVVAGFGEYVDKPVVEEKQHFTPENKMMPAADENKAEVILETVAADVSTQAAPETAPETAPADIQPVPTPTKNKHRRG
jgi:hypothetical protein